MGPWETETAPSSLSATVIREGKAGGPWRWASPNRVHKSRGEENSSRPHPSDWQAQGENLGDPSHTPLPWVLCKVATLIQRAAAATELAQRQETNDKQVDTRGQLRVGEKADGTWEVWL